MPAVNRVTRWIRIGPLSLQPAELSKPVFVLFLADQLSRKAGRLAEWRSAVLPCLCVLGILSLLIALEPDAGTPVLLLLLFGALLFLGGVPKRIVLLLGGAALLLLAAYTVSADYRMERLLAFLHPGSDPRGAGYQVHQSLIAVGSGGIAGSSRDGLLGTGLGAGMQKLFYLPYPHTDFIFAVVGEELGLLGTSAVVALFSLVLWRGFRAAFRAEDSFGILFGSGLTILLVGQALLNMGVVLDLLPTKGFPLPFLSYGGTSLVVSAASAGFLLRMGQR